MSTEVLTAEVDAQRLRLSARMQENSLREEWRSLAAVLAHPDMPMATVSGDIENNLPDIDESRVTEIIAAQSPATGIAEAAATRAAAEISKAKSAAIPDLQLRGGLQYNNELLGTAPYAVGWEGIADFPSNFPSSIAIRAMSAPLPPIWIARNSNSTASLSLCANAPPRSTSTPLQNSWPPNIARKCFRAPEILRPDVPEKCGHARRLSTRPRFPKKTLQLPSRIHRRTRNSLDYRHCPPGLSVNRRPGGPRQSR